MALAASNLANPQTVTRGATNKEVSHRSSTPDYAHYKIGLQLYNGSIRMLYSGPVGSADDATLKLAITILLTGFEPESGSPLAFFTHVEGANAIVKAQHESISRSTLGRDILSTWACMHAEIRFRRLPFRFLTVESDGDPAGIRWLRQKYPSREGRVFTCLGESYALHQRVILERCMRLEHEDADTTLRRCVSWYSRNFDFSFATEGEGIPSHHRYASSGALIQSLAEQRRILDASHDDLGIDELPIERFTSRHIASDGDADTSHKLVIRPLVFRTDA